MKNLCDIFPIRSRDELRESLLLWTIFFPEICGFFFVRLHEGKILTENTEIGEAAEIAAENGIDGRKFARAFMWLENRCPTWPEMVALNNLLFTPEEPTFQVHPKKVDYINDHKTALHVWKTLDDIMSYIALQEMKMLVSLVLDEFKGKQIPSKREVLSGEMWGKRYVAIWGGDDWPTWEEVCKIKQAEFGDDVTALQFHISRELDLNEERVLLLWHAGDLPFIKLPPKDIV